MIKPLKEWTVKELYDYGMSRCKNIECDRCPLTHDRCLCEAVLFIKEMKKETLDIYVESGGFKYARDN